MALPAYLPRGRGWRMGDGERSFPGQQAGQGGPPRPRLGVRASSSPPRRPCPQRRRAPALIPCLPPAEGGCPAQPGTETEREAARSSRGSAQAAAAGPGGSAGLRWAAEGPPRLCPHRLDCSRLVQKRNSVTSFLFFLSFFFFEGRRRSSFFVPLPLKKDELSHLWIVHLFSP